MHVTVCLQLHHFAFMASYHPALLSPVLPVTCLLTFYSWHMSRAFIMNAFKQWAPSSGNVLHITGDEQAYVGGKSGLFLLLCKPFNMQLVLESLTVNQNTANR